MNSALKITLGSAAIVFALACASARPPATVERAPSRFAEFHGARIHYRVEGRGEPALVFVHGWSCDMSFWSEQVPHFAARHQVVVIDLPGHGLSAAPAGPLSMDVFADSVDAVLRDAKIARAVLVGHSMGTPVVRQFYRRHPEKTLGLVAVDGALRPFSTDPKFAEAFLAPLRGQDYAAGLAKMVNGMTASVPDARKKEHIRTTMLATPQSVIVRAGEGMLDPQIWGDDPIRVPVLVVVAKSSGWPPDYQTYVQTLAPDARYIAFEKVSHFVMMDDPGRFNTVLDSFLQGELLKKSR